MQTREGWTAEDLERRAAEVKAETLAKGENHTGNGFGLSLAAQATTWPTPAARDFKGANGPAHLTAGTGRKHMDQLPNFVEHSPFTPSARETSAGAKSSTPRRALNPLFVEWLMGWPPGWTDASTPISRAAPTGCGSPGTASCLWLPRMRTELSRLLSPEPTQQASLF